MKIVTWNVNGIRACIKKGFLDYVKSENPDILCIQETKANEEQVPDEIRNMESYFSYWHSAERKGYSGVAVFSKIKPNRVKFGFGIDKFDREGRVIELEYDDFILFNVYFPNGQRDDERLNFKLEFYEEFFKYCNDLKNEGKNLIICGDYNTAYNEIDLANPKANSERSGFLPIEREWMDRIIKLGFVDVFRYFYKDKIQYTWWTYRFGARRRNIGWRIDYFFVNNDFLNNVNDCVIQNDVLGSDHCPVVLKLNI